MKVLVEAVKVMDKKEEEEMEVVVVVVAAAAVVVIVVVVLAMLLLHGPVNALKRPITPVHSNEKRWRTGVRD
jgi:hypothetical protein